MFLRMLSDFLRKRPHAKTPSPRPSTRLRLEELEDRMVPSFVANTYTNASVQITPGFTVTETVTATVSPFPSFKFTPGAPGTNPIPAGATTPTGGRVLFNLNNTQQSATLNGNGQATVTFQVPILAFLTSQTLQVEFLGFTDPSGNFYDPSTFLAPLYKNWDNVLHAGTLSFPQLTPQQVYAEFFALYSTNPAASFQNLTTLNPYYTAQGETDTVSFGGIPVAFNYVDPGNISTLTVLGFQLPGSFALALNAYAGISTASS